MQDMDYARARMAQTGWFTQPGAYVLVDGQYGSTGKGLLAAYMAHIGGSRIDAVTTNAGPNSGHTAYYVGEDSDEAEKIVTKQIPVAGVVAHKLGWRPVVHMNAGAIINPAIVEEELKKYFSKDSQRYVSIHPRAAIIEEQDLHNTDALAKIASTNKGVGQALARKVLREGNVACLSPEAQHLGPMVDIPDEVAHGKTWPVVFVETAQGYSLGVNGGFYPYTTSRECTVGQALSDAGIHPSFFRKCVMAVRTYPIRVGNTDLGFSGNCYPDQREATWEEIGQTPEYTTVTNRVRRVFTWSRMQFKDALQANKPELIFLNFVNYLTEKQLSRLLEDMQSDYEAVMGRKMEAILLGYGPKTEDIKWLDL